jgi:acetolactate synthase I/II/III large subunit
MKNRIADSGAEAVIETFNSLGIDHIFFNPGIDLVPLMASVAHFKRAGRKAPHLITCTDESVAVAAAHGAAMVTERPQIVAVFEDIGLLQGGGAIVNLQYGQIPVILFSGRNSSSGRLNWKDEQFDQRKIVRDYVKWDYEASDGEDLSAVVREAVRRSGSEPCGPVYVDFPRNLLLSPTGHTKPSFTMEPAKEPSTNQPGVIAQIARIMIEADNPLIITAYSGRHADTVAPLVELAELLGTRVITTDRRMNFPSTHPLCPGIDCIRGDSYDHYIAEADVVLTIDYDFPGPMPKAVQPRKDAALIHIDNEPLKYGKPLWNRPADILVEGDSQFILPDLVSAVRGLLTPAQRERFITRAEEVADEHRKAKDERHREGLAEANASPISPGWLSYCLNRAVDDDTIIIHQIPSHADALAQHLTRTKPGTIFTWGGKAGSMGWPLPAAFGAKLAAPDKTVVSLIGDGGFIYGCPTATLWGADAYDAPFLTVIFNNSAYASFRDVMAMYYGEDMKDAVVGDLGIAAGITIADPPDFAGIARACRAYGETVTDPSLVPSALNRALDEVRTGRSAVLDVRLCR